MSESRESSLKLNLPKSSKEGTRSPSNALQSDLIGSDLRKQRGLYKARLTSFEKYILKFEGIVEKSQIIELNLKISVIESVFHEFNKIQNTIELSVDDNEIEKQIEYRENFEEQYFKCVSLAKSLLEGSDNVNSKGSVNISYNTSQIKLPDIKLPFFFGFI